MSDSNHIRTVIIDEDQECVDSLKESLSVFPEIELCGSAIRYEQARDLLLNNKPDLVFLGIEIPNKRKGFDLLNEVRNKGYSFSIVFCTVYDKYVIRALKESVFDYITKPVDPEELKNIVNLYEARKIPGSLNSLHFPVRKGLSGIVALPTHTGLRFVGKNRILLFRCIHDDHVNKSCWEALLDDFSSVKFGNNITAGRIIQLFSGECFVQINQSYIVNLHYVEMLEFKTRHCILISPYNDMELTVSRTYLLKMRQVYEKF